jgi:hypothetical protein
MKITAGPGCGVVIVALIVLTAPSVVIDSHVAGLVLLLLGFVWPVRDTGAPKT